ncbi:ImmA/IrrE family metallo-endopeptidase [Micrococcales bacterium 31B]|nr:ImmA/IrrE family metallo-endopeptidase [Micrococcales bacterium 31B]
MASNYEREAERAAQRFRQTYRLGMQPLGDLAALIEQTTGHDVAILDAADDEHGLTMRDPVRGRAFIGVARSTNPMRQRSTLAHELAHVIFDDQSDDLAARSKEESRADAFARHLLAPRQGVVDLLEGLEPVGDAALAQVVQRYLVSPAIAAIVMRDAGYIDPETAKRWMKLSTHQVATRFGWSDHYSVLKSYSNRLRAPQGLLARAVAGYAEGVVSAQTIAALRGLKVEVVEAELRAAGIVARKVDATEFDVRDLPAVEVDLSGLEDEGVTS